MSLFENKIYYFGDSQEWSICYARRAASFLSQCQQNSQLQGESKHKIKFLQDVSKHIIKYYSDSLNHVQVGSKVLTTLQLNGEPNHLKIYINYRLT